MFYTIEIYCVLSTSYIKLTQMKTVTRQKNIPEGSIITQNFETIHYGDTFKGRLITSETIDNITTGIMSMPRWVNVLMSIRNLIVGIFGLKTGNARITAVNEQYNVGSRVGYFWVLDRNENEIVLGENDKHLNFRASVFMDCENKYVYLNTVVFFNNWLGRLYFVPVKPFHIIIIRSVMKSFIRKKSIIRKS